MLQLKLQKLETTEKGFSVVAERIRKLSKETTSAVVNIKNILDSISSSVSIMHSSLENPSDSTKTQAINSEQILSVLEELSATTQLLANLSKTL